MSKRGQHARLRTGRDTNYSEPAAQDAEIRELLARIADAESTQQDRPVSPSRLTRRQKHLASRAKRLAEVAIAKPEVRQEKVAIKLHGGPFDGQFALAYGAVVGTIIEVNHSSYRITEIKYMSARPELLAQAIFRPLRRADAANPK